MTKPENTVLVTLFGLSALACIALSSSAAQAGPVAPSGHYCLSYDEGGTDCSFMSYQQCLATASGIAAECYGYPARERAEGSPVFGWIAHRHQHS
jgi:hypothetical protein